MTGAWYRIADEAEVASPALLLHPARVAENVRRMIGLAGDAARLRPHVKTHKLPQIVRLLGSLGVRKVKTATIAESEMAADAGAADVLLAYPPVGPAVERVVALARSRPEVRWRTIADAPAAVVALGRAAAAAGITLDVLVDLDLGMHRTGIPCGPAAAALYAEIAATPGLAAAGLHAYDGHLRDPDPARLAAAADAAFAPVERLRADLEAAGLPVPLVVAGGTPTFAAHARRPDVELGAGTMLLWDTGETVKNPTLDFLPAAVLLTRVVSRPGPDLLCLDLGYKAVASEMPHPRVRIFGLEDADFVGHSEEHLVVSTPRADDFPVGTVLYAVPWHICPTVALQAEVVVVEGGRAVDRWPVVARARRLTV